MVYGFDFYNDMIYAQNGFDSFVDAKKGLEKIASGALRYEGKAKGSVYELDLENLEIIRRIEFDIDCENFKVTLKERL